VEASERYTQDVFLCFIDYDKAFDCVDHKILWTFLRDTGFPEHLVMLVHNLYDKKKVVVRTEHGDIKPFPIEKGVRQGCVLSPLLFNLYAERLIKYAALEKTGEGNGISGRTINIFRYSDDIKLAAETAVGLESVIKRVVTSSARAGLYLNVRKTKAFTTAGITLFKVNNEDIEVIQQFNLLGSNI